MDKIKVVDARMGRGKSTAAIRYIEEHKEDHPILYITPYLSEVERVCKWCDLDEPKQEQTFEDGDDSEEDEYIPKSVLLKDHLKAGDSIGATHALFYLMDEEALELVKEKRYSLIIDEAIEVLSKIPISYHDMQIIMDHQAEAGEDGMLVWKNDEYNGKLNGYKHMIQSKSVYYNDATFISALNQDLLRAFTDVFILTYRFPGSCLNAYLECFGLEYEFYGIDNDERGPYFCPGRDKPPAVDFSGLLLIEKDSAYNRVGEETYSLAKNWYRTKEYDDAEIVTLRKNMSNFLRRARGKEARHSRMWTCFNDYKELLIPERGTCRDNFVPLNLKATNEFRRCTHLAYMVNRFEDPNVLKFFAKRGFVIDRDAIALSEMLQWIWRSAIRDGKPVKLYIPSYRMRHLLINWINEEKKGVKRNEE